MYTDGQKKRYDKILSCIACELHKLTMTRILSQASVYFNLSILNTNIHVYILTAVTFFPYY